MPELKVSSCQDNKHKWGCRRKREDKEGRGGPGHTAAGQITTTVMIILRVGAVADHFPPGIVLSVFHGLSHSALTTIL